MRPKFICTWRPVVHVRVRLRLDRCSEGVERWCGSGRAAPALSASDEVETTGSSASRAQPAKPVSQGPRPQSCPRASPHGSLQTRPCGPAQKATGRHQDLSSPPVHLGHLLKCHSWRDSCSLPRLRLPCLSDVTTVPVERGPSLGGRVPATRVTDTVLSLSRTLLAGCQERVHLWSRYRK